MFQTAQYYNLTNNLFTHPYDPDIVFKIEDMHIFLDQEVPMEDLVEDLHIKTKRIQDLDLTIEETTMASALCMMIPGR